MLGDVEATSPEIASDLGIYGKFGLKRRARFRLSRLSVVTIFPTWTWPVETTLAGWVQSTRTQKCHFAFLQVGWRNQASKLFECQEYGTDKQISVLDTVVFDRILMAILLFDNLM